MPRDYKSRSRRSRDEHESEGPSPLVWLFVGILIGLIISGIFYLRGQHSTPVTINKPAPTTKHIPKKVEEDKGIQPDQKQTPTNSQNLQTQFDFYNVLPNKSQNSPAPTVSPTTTSPTTVSPGPAQTSSSAATSTSKATTGSYAVQIATMSKSSDADQLKAQLLLLGFDVNVTPVTKNGQTLERVWIGPFTNKNDAVGTQKQLQQNQITSKLLKLVS
jgi:cell division protein FtsN